MKDLYAGIIGILTEDSRTDNKRLAVMLNRTEKEVAAAVAELEKRGAIVKYSAVINKDKLGIDTVEALIEVKVSPQRRKGFDAVAEEIYQFAEVKSLYLMSGAYDLAVFIEGKTLKQVAGFVSEKLSVMEGVLSTATHFILKKYKIDGVLTEAAEKRLSVHE